MVGEQDAVAVLSRQSDHAVLLDEHRPSTTEVGGDNQGCVWSALGFGRQQQRRLHTALKGLAGAARSDDGAARQVAVLEHALDEVVGEKVEHGGAGGKRWENGGGLDQLVLDVCLWFFAKPKQAALGRLEGAR